MLLDQKLRDVCIQDPRRETAYLIPGDDLSQYACDGLPDDIRAAAVTFSLSEDALFDEVPELVPVPSAEPSVIIRDADRGQECYLSFVQLQEFRIARPDVHPAAKTFTLPMAEALVQEMPSAVRALLQTDVTDTRLGPARRS